VLAGRGAAVQRVSPDSIIRLVARYYQLPVTQLNGSSRRHSLVRARGLAIYLIRDLTGISFQQIGKYFAGRDHTTVLHAFRKADALIQCDPDAQMAVSELLASAKCQK
jgi:chromosomal replication initiator protein